jgi:hypothetical protein
MVRYAYEVHPIPSNAALDVQRMPQLYDIFECEVDRAPRLLAVAQNIACARMIVNALDALQEIQHAAKLYPIQADPEEENV